ARDRRGERIAFDTAGFDARIIQHELDHLDGILFIDRLAKVDDLYRLVAKSDSEESERAPLTEAQAAAVRAQIRALPPDALRWR
ncbi:MAG TPA: peptide deformylase, partial [Limnochordia bacterium]|nr:peptide deformylase [Limnochordia bacterium]